MAISFLTCGWFDNESLFVARESILRCSEYLSFHPRTWQILIYSAIYKAICEYFDITIFSMMLEIRYAYFNYIFIIWFVSALGILFKYHAPGGV